MPEQLTVNISTIGVIMRQVITDPREFFRRMPKSGGYGDPVLYLAVMGFIDGLVIWLLDLFGLGGGMMSSASVPGLLMMAIMAPLGGFVVAFFAYLLWRFMGSRQSYEAAYRCLAFIASIGPVIMLLQVIPYLGTVVNVLWGFWLLFIASTEVHGLAPARVKSVMVILAVIFLVIGLQGERSNRRLQAGVAGFTQQMQSLQGKTPEQMGQAVGEFLKGVEKGAKP